jgi:hypothetical protein
MARKTKKPVRAKKTPRPVARPVAETEPPGRETRFIEMTGKTLRMLIDQDDEITPEQLSLAGVTDERLVRVNLQGDIELRQMDRWDVIGGLIGNFEARVRRATGLDWA